MRGFSSCEMVITEIENVRRLKAKDAPTQKALRGNTHCIILLSTVSETTSDDGEKTPGSKVIISQNVKLSGKPGSVFFLPSGREYQWEDSLRQPDGGPSYDALRIVFTTAQEIQIKPFVVHTQKTNKWNAVFTSIDSLWNSKKPSAKTRCLSLLYQVLAMLEEVSARGDMPTNRQNMLEKALACLEENIKQPQFSVESLAPLTGMCPTYFRQLFRRMYGLSPKQYLLDKRIKLACELLSGTNLYITAIARESGFSSLYYFSKAFKGATGKSPRAYRESGM
jgi:AraC-like DNA-binding protein